MPLARHRLLDTLTQLGPHLLSSPEITFSGPVDLVVTGDLADDVLAVVRETVANVARHARARRTVVSVEATEREVIVKVEDDGAGMGDSPGPASGTANLRDRAARRGGTFTLDAAPQGGTRACWRVPVW